MCDKISKSVTNINLYSDSTDFDSPSIKIKYRVDNGSHNLKTIVQVLTDLTAVESLNYCNSDLFLRIHFLLKVLASILVLTATLDR